MQKKWMPKYYCAVIPFLFGINISKAEVTKEKLKAISSQVPGRDFRTHPPKIKSMYVFPSTKSSNDEKVLMEVYIDESLPKVLEYVWKNDIATLRDDGIGGDKMSGDRIYTTRVSLDMSKLQNISNAKAGDYVGLSAEARGGIAIPVFGNHVATLDNAERSAISEALNLESSLATQNLFIDPERSLLIRDLSVVNDPTRTKDPCQSTSQADSTKKWSFGYLLTQMADDPSISGTQKTASQFAIDWLSRWSSFSPTVNGQSLTQQPGPSTRNTPSTILTKWRVASGSSSSSGPVRMHKAPFRLLAIVNRIDLRHNLLFGEGLAGELRFVFAILDNAVRETSNGPCALLDIQENTSPTLFARASHTVILEYAVDKQSQQQVFEWAQSWQALSELTLNSTQYRAALESLTESVVTRGKGTSFGRPNGSALIRIRTNQSLNNTLWELREFQINNTIGSTYRHSPVPVTVKQTPQGRTASSTNDKNEIWNLGKWISSNYNGVEAESHNVPKSFPSGQGYDSPLSQFLGARSITNTDRNLAGGSNTWDFQGQWTPSGGWLNYDDPRDVEVRHRFSRNTCNGCHGFEVRPAIENTDIAFHIKPRIYTKISELSNFLTGLPMVENPLPGDFVFVPDPIVPSVERHFNDLDMRRQDMMSLLFNGPEGSLSFQPSNRTH